MALGTRTPWAAAVGRRFRLPKDVKSWPPGACEGLVLVTGGSASLAELCTPQNCRVLHIPGSLSSLKDVDDLIERAEEEYPGEAIAGLLHIGGEVFIS